MSTAVAILDLSGGIVGLRSGRGFSFGQIIKFVSGSCTPVMVASDVSPPGKLLARVAAAFSVGVFRPKENVSKSAKSRLVEHFDLSERERHKKDALAAAVSAYESNRAFIARIERKVRESGMSGTVEVDDVARMIFSGESNNIDSAIRSLSGGK